MLFADINKGIEEYETTEGAVLIDVREPDEFESGHISGAVNLPLSKIRSISFDKNVPLFLYCLRGSRSMSAASILKKMGYLHVKSIGGINRYKGSME